MGFDLAQGGSTCFDVGELAVWSWTIKGRAYYSAHGSTHAQLVGGDADAGNDPGRWGANRLLKQTALSGLAAADDHRAR